VTSPDGISGAREQLRSMTIPVLEDPEMVRAAASRLMQTVSTLLAAYQYDAVELPVAGATRCY